MRFVRDIVVPYPLKSCVFDKIEICIYRVQNLTIVPSKKRISFDFTHEIPKVRQFQLKNGSRLGMSVYDILKMFILGCFL